MSEFARAVDVVGELNEAGPPSAWLEANEIERGDYLGTAVAVTKSSMPLLVDRGFDFVVIASLISYSMQIGFTAGRARGFPQSE